MRKLLAVLALAGGCATNPALGNALTSVRGDSPVVECDSGCVAPWQRAQIWVGGHAVMKVQIANDVLIQTYNTTGSDASYTITVTKEPLPASGKYRVAISLVCGNLFGCQPDAGNVAQAFAHYVRTGEDVLRGVALYGQAIRE
jgi:hypothetical protein